MRGQRMAEISISTGMSADMSVEIGADTRPIIYRWLSAEYRSSVGGLSAVNCQWSIGPLSYNSVRFINYTHYAWIILNAGYAVVHGML